jgi:hypothetical protein
LGVGTLCSLLLNPREKDAHTTFFLILNLLQMI